MTGPEIYAERPTPNLRLHIGHRQWKLRTKCSHSPLDKLLLSLLLIPDDLGLCRPGFETFFFYHDTALDH